MTITLHTPGVRSISFETLRLEIQNVIGRRDTAPRELVDQAEDLHVKAMLASTPREEQDIAEHWDAALRKFLPAERTGPRNIFGRRRAVRPRIPSTLIVPQRFIDHVARKRRMLSLNPQVSVLAHELAERISRLRSTAFHQGRVPLTVTISEFTLEGIQKILGGATGAEEQPGQIVAGIGHIVRTLPKELGHVQADLALRTDVETLLADLQKAFPDPTPFSTEATTIDRLRAALAADGRGANAPKQCHPDAEDQE